MNEILDYLSKQIVIYELRQKEYPAYYFDGRLDAYREIYNIIANMPDKGAKKKCSK